jgi:hypothetical protein
MRSVIHTIRKSEYQYIILLILFFGAGCGTIDLKSRWRDRDVIIDGKNTEWRYLTVLDDKETSVGALNDGNFVYLILITSNRELLNQVRRRGITIWFDHEGGTEKKFGVHYPIGFGGFRSTQEGRPDGEDQAQDMRKENSVEELEIYGPKEDDRHRMTLAETGGIEARFRTANDVLVYELKVPLADNGLHPFAIGTKPGTLVGVGVETLTDRSPEKPPEKFAGGTGERGSRPMGRRGGGGGRSGTSGRSEPFKMWAKVQLATNDTVSH